MRFLLLLALSCDAQPLDLVRQRLLAQYIYLPASELASAAVSARQFASSLLPNHTWVDINYDDPGDRAIWKTETHLTRTYTMVAAWADPGSPAHGEGALVSSARNSLAWWLEADPQNENWWFNLISTPQIIASIFNLFSAGNATSWPSQWDIERGFMIMYRSAWWNSSLGYESSGANLAWMVQTQLVRGILPFAPNQSALDQGFARLWEESRTVNRSLDFEAAQGIQVDHSYSFHGPQIQVASYGQDFAAELIAMAAVAAGTPWALDASAASTLCAFLAKGMAWLSVGRSFDWTIAGRQASRNTWDAEFKVSLSSSALRNFAASSCAAAAPEDGAGVRVWADRLDFLPTSPSSPPLIGARSFWANDFTVARRAGWVASLRAHSNRTMPNECGNGENLLGRYESEGVLNIVATDCGPNGTSPTGCGLEYATIFPLLNWTLLNGVVSRSSAPLSNCTAQCCWEAEISRPPFVVAATDGSFAAAAVDTEIGPLTAHRLFLFFNDSVLVLTAGASDASGAQISTGVAQRFLHQPGGLLVSHRGGGAPVLLPDGVHPAVPDLEWAYADGVGWLMPSFLDAATATAVPSVDAGMRSGNWSSIGPYPGNKTGRVLTLSLSHGANLDDASWAYAVVPAQTGESMPAAANFLRGALLIGVNSQVVQAAAHVGSAGAAAAALVVWPAADGTLGGAGATISSGSFSLSINTTAPCVVTYAEQPDVGGRPWVFVTAASPLPAIHAVNVTLSRRLSPRAPGAGNFSCTTVAAADSGSTTLVFRLPNDPNSTLGQAVVMACAL